MHDVEVRVRLENTAKYAARLEIVRDYLVAREKLDPMVMKLSQCRETLDGLMLFKEEEGLEIPDKALEALEKDEAKFFVEAKALDVEDLPREILYATPPHSTLAEDVQAEVPAGVDQYGTIDSRATAVDLAELPDEET